MLALTPEQSYLRTKCGLRPRAGDILLTLDPDDPKFRQLDPAQAAAAAHVSRATIDTWKDRGLLHSVSEDDDHPLYIEYEVLSVELATRRAPRIRRLAEEADADRPAT